MNTRNLKITASRCVLAGSLAATLAAAGCMVGPNYKPPATTMPAAYREPTNGPTTGPAFVASNAPAEIRWWRQLGDPQLTNLVERSVTANYSVVIAEARLHEAREGRHMAQAMLYPQVNAGASVLRYRLSDSVVNLPALNSEDGLFQVGFDAAWAVDLFGGIRRGVETSSMVAEPVPA
jgi:outer membrane protein, multidrug efflux system